MNPLLMRAVAEYAVFLALSEDEIVDPDTAVSKLEELSSILKELTPVERDIFIQFIQGMADAELKGYQSEARIECLLSLPESMGLRD